MVVTVEGGMRSDRGSIGGRKIMMLPRGSVGKDAWGRWALFDNLKGEG